MENIYAQINALKGKIKKPYYPFIEVDEGWFQIVLDCHKELEAIDPEYAPLQIKEKFGELRYYYEPSNQLLRESMDAVIRKYEQISRQTCEVTGKPGVLMKSIGGWYKTLNEDFAATHMSYGKYTAVEQSN